ncbi:MAG: dihydroorotate dehydrogenase electron transfer subunit [Spirochaetaceae bacterium]|nr:dihydroorotate dehydrogenase electron transfer subunit [Spirochaetaceae bacterium]
MRRFDTIVTENRPVADGYRELRFAWPPDDGRRADDGRNADDPAPGRFFTLRAGGRYDPALRRPFAFSDWRPSGGAGGGEAACVFQLRGRGTEHLAALRPGDGLDALGPLGRGFGKPPRGARPLLIAGGIGVGPMLYLAAALAADAAAGLCEAPILAVGARTAALVPVGLLPAGTAVCTDDGSAGFRGTVADWLASFDPGLPPAFYACGPAPMMAAVAAITTARRAPYEAAVEQWMACGVGACAGCAVRLRSGDYAKACSDGPVLDGNKVDWEAMA